MVSRSPKIWPNLEGWATDYPAGTEIETHFHDAHQMVHAISGVMRVRTGDEVWVVPPGRGLWLPARCEHAIRCISLVRMRTVYIRGGDGFPDTVRVSEITPLLREVMVRIADGGEATLMPHLTALLVHEIAQGGSEGLCMTVPEDARIAKLATCMRTNPADRSSLSEWAKRLGMSDRTLIRQIRKQTGQSFRDLRRQARIMAGLERLSQGVPVTTVALDVGFESPSAFIQAFRSVTGKTPGRYISRGGRDSKGGE